MRAQPAALPSSRQFARHVARNAALAVGLAVAAVAAGAVGFHGLNGLGWLDAVLDASLTLNGVGPVHPIEGTWAKWFVAAYALVGGLVYLSTIGIFLAPLARHMMHRLHLDMYGEAEEESPGPPASP
jgi:hypothetical protein